jgi:hypothetical protein
MVIDHSSDKRNSRLNDAPDAYRHFDRRRRRTKVAVNP